MAGAPSGNGRGDDFATASAGAAALNGQGNAMSKITAISSGLALAVMLAFPALAQTQPQPQMDQNQPPKALEVTPSPGGKPKIKQGDLPDEFIEMREKVKAEFNDWMKADQDIQKQCNDTHSVADRIACEKNQKASQARLDTVNAHTRDMLRKIDNYRRKQAGLPPPPWWAEENKKAGIVGNGNRDLHPPPPPPPPKENNSVLLPQGGASLPANTF